MDKVENHYFEKEYKCSLSQDTSGIYYCGRGILYLHTNTNSDRSVGFNKDQLEKLISDLHKVRIAMDNELSPTEYRKLRRQEKIESEAGE